MNLKVHINKQTSSLLPPPESQKKPHATIRIHVWIGLDCLCVCVSSYHPFHQVTTLMTSLTKLLNIATHCCSSFCFFKAAVVIGLMGANALKYCHHHKFFFTLYLCQFVNHSSFLNLYDNNDHAHEEKKSSCLPPWRRSINNKNVAMKNSLSESITTTTTALIFFLFKKNNNTLPLTANIISADETFKGTSAKFFTLNNKYSSPKKSGTHTCKKYKYA